MNFLDQKLLEPFEALTPAERSRLFRISATWLDDYGIVLEGDPIISSLQAGLRLSCSPRPDKSEADDNTLGYWRTFAESGEHLLFAARSARNLWLVRDGQKPIEHEERAVGLFRQIAEQSGAKPTARASALAEAIELAAETRRRDQLGPLVDLAAQLLHEFVQDCDGHDPACLDRYYEQFPTGPEGRRDFEKAKLELAEVNFERRFHDALIALIDSLAELAGGNYSDLVSSDELLDEVWRVAQEVAASDLLCRDIEPALRSLARSDRQAREKVTRWWIERETKRADGLDDMNRWLTLVDLQIHARNEGLREISDGLLSKIQEIDITSGLAAISSEIEVSQLKVEEAKAEVERICSHESALEALDAFAEHALSYKLPTPGGHGTEGFAGLFPTVHIGHESSAAKKTPPTTQPDGSPPEPLAVQTQQASTHLLKVMLQAELIAVPALECIFERFGDSIEQELATRAQASNFLDEVRALRAAEAVMMWDQDQWDASAHSLTPRIEKAVRNAAKSHRVVVIQNTDGTSRGGHTSLNQVISALKDKMPEDVRTHLDWLLTSDLGANLRNDIAHGDRTEIDQKWSAVLIHSYLLALRTFTGPLSSADEEE